MRTRNIFFNILVPATSGVVIYIYIYYGRYWEIPDFIDHLGFYFLAILSGASIGILMRYIDSRFRSYWQDNINIAYLIGLQLLIKSIITLLFIGSICWMAMGITHSFDIMWIWETYHDEILTLGILTLGSMLIYSIISFALQSYNYYAHHKIERLKHERQQVELQYEALKSQLSPHYLFNCLNTISSLIHENASLTEDFIRRMAKTFQYVLSNDHKKLVPIVEEVEFVKAYNYLLKVRFENQLILNIDLPGNVLEGNIPPLTLQMLLENVVKHNVIDKDNKVTVNIYSTEDHTLIIENNRTSEPDSQESFKIGLENIKKRYQHLTNRPIKINDGERYKVIIPIIDISEEVYA